MRTISAAHQAVLDTGNVAWSLTVETKDAGGTWRLLNSYPGYNALTSVEWGESLDDVGQFATITLARNSHLHSVSPLMTAAPVNTAFTPGGGFTALIAVGREVRIKATPAPVDGSPTVADTWFHGVIDRVDMADGDSVVLECRDMVAGLVDSFLINDYVFAFGADTGTTIGMRIWQPDHDFTVGEYMLPTEANRETAGSTRKFFKCTTAGTTGATEPAWNSAGTTASGTAVFTAIADTSDAGFSLESVLASMVNVSISTAPPAIYTPVSPAFALKPWKQSRTGLFSAMRTAVMQRGWDLRFKWRAATSQHELTLYEPDRAKTAPDQTFGPSQYVSVNGASVGVEQVRNWIRVVYSDSGDKLREGTPKRKTVEVEDATSITKYGGPNAIKRRMEIAEDSTGQIDSEAEALAMANAALSDLKEPKVSAGVSLVGGFPWVELGDLYRFSANGSHWDTDQDLAVFQYRHRAQNGTLRTELQLRGQPSAGFDKWHRLDSRATPEGSHALTVFQSGTGIQVGTEAVVGGAKINVTRGMEKTAPTEQAFEYHVSETTGFTPSTATLASYSTSRTLTLADLKPGVPYFGRVIPRTVNAGKPVAGEPSAEFEFEAGRATAGHAYADVEWSRLPLNGGFETQSNPLAPPDHWEEVPTYGVWGTDFTYHVGDGTGISGDAYIRLVSNAGQTQIINTALFPVTPGRRILIRSHVRIRSGTAGSVRVRAYFYEDDGVTPEGNQASRAVAYNSDVGNWQQLDKYVTVPTDARLCRIAFEKDDFGGGEDVEADFDGVRADYVDWNPGFTGVVASSGTYTKNAATYSDLTDTSVAINHRISGQELCFWAYGNLFTTVAGDWARFRVSFDGGVTGVYSTEYNLVLNQANVNVPFAFSGKVTMPDAMYGSINATLQWQRFAGTGTLTINAANSVGLLLL